MTKLLDVVVLTDHRWINPSNKDPYTLNVLKEDQLIVSALQKEGLAVARKAWDDPDFDWTNTKSVLFRTTWDYFDRFKEFSRWLNQVSKQTRLFNSEKIIRWNLDKHYLKYLLQQEVRITPTCFIEQDEPRSLDAILKETGWHDVVLKPCVSGAARHTYRINPANVITHNKIFRELIEEEAMMLQPFQYQIVKQGELSLMVINGKFTHAILKKAKPGDFRVQDDFGGSVHPFTPNENAIKFAEKAVKCCIENPIYARVDMFIDNQNEWALSELELIEPELWFRFHPEAASILARSMAGII